MLCGGRLPGVADCAAVAGVVLLLAGMLLLGSWTRWAIWPAAIAGYGLVAALNPSGRYDATSGEVVAIEGAAHWLPSAIEGQVALRATAQLAALACLLPLAALVGRSFKAARYMGIALGSGLVIWTVASAGLKLVDVTVFDLVDPADAWAWRHGLPFGTIDYHNNAGTVVAIGLGFAGFGIAWPASRVAAEQGEQARRGLRFAISAAMAGACVVAAGINPSRAALMLCVAMLPVCLIWHGLTLRRGCGVAAALLVAIAAVSLTAVPSDAQSSVERLDELAEQVAPEYYPRKMEVRVAGELIRERPLFGHGPGTYAIASAKSSIEGHFFVPPYRPGQTRDAQHAANADAMQLLVSWGVVGGAIFLLPVAAVPVVLLGRRKAFSPEARRLRLTLLAGLLAVALHGLVDCPLQLPMIQAAVLVMLGLLLASPTWAIGPSSAAGSDIQAERETPRETKSQA